MRMFTCIYSLWLSLKAYNATLNIIKGHYNVSNLWQILWMEWRVLTIHYNSFHPPLFLQHLKYFTVDKKSLNCSILHDAYLCGGGGVWVCVYTQTHIHMSYTCIFHDFGIIPFSAFFCLNKNNAFYDRTYFIWPHTYTLS